MDFTLTVGSSTEWDEMERHSNHGAGVDILAPGLDVTVAGTSNSELKIDSGTSLAAPHVAGLALYLLQMHGFMRPWALKRLILNLSTNGKLKNLPKNTPNRLAFNKGGGVALDF